MRFFAPIFLFIISFCIIRNTALDFCQDADFEFTYTNCDENGERWRVAVPRGGGGKQCGNLPQPQKGLNCSFSCPPGNYLDIDTQQCRACRAGFFSLGGGVRFEEFVTLPAAFSIYNFDADTAVAARQQNLCPKEAGWIVKDGELLYIPTPCVSRLSFSANLVRAGAVEYTYRMPRNNRALSMQVDVRNEQCQSYSDLAKSMLLKYTSSANAEHEEKNGDWRRRTVELRTGQNVISWTVSNSYGLNGYTTEPIHFARIDVLGLAFTKECSACPPGTYSAPGAAECKPCAAGYFSSKGSAQCGQCPLSQYSGPKSSRCIERPACKPQDYYPVRTPCLANGTSRVVYEKVLPALCRDDVPGASKLPSPGPWQPCPKCNPGMAKNKEGVCEFCRKDYHSDGNECTRCPVDTVPNYGLQYTNWQTLPPKLETRCEYISDDISEKCRIGESWLAGGDSLATPPSLERGIAFELVLSIDEGFWNPLAPKHMKVPVAQITIVFETSCADSSCVLYFIEDVSAGGAARKESFYRFLAAFNGTQSKRVWLHTVTKNTPAKYMLAFLRSGVAASDDAITDVARIFAINVTNVGHRGGQGGGGSECLACPHSGSGDGCVPCPMGQYIHEETKLCVSCPANTIINATSSRIGVASCVTCGQGLAPSTDGTSCVTPPRLTIRDPNPTKNITYNYDFATWRDKNWTLEGVRVFSREGTAYYHAFRVALFQSIKCEEEYESSDVIGVMMDESMREAVDGMACRMTALPGGNGNGKNVSKTAFVSPLLLANKLDAITLNRTHKSWNISDHVLEYEGLDNKSLPLDVFFWFEQLSIATSATCPRGNIFVVVARCAPNKKTAEMRLPHSCPDGTCDGCMFSAILESSQACPICDKDDYETIRGECVGGRQTIHSIPHKHCVLTGSASESHESACSILSASQKMFLFMGAASFITLSIILFLMCRRNQRLEYKYTRLIESKTGELPAAETCGIEEDEEDDELQDRVIFSKGSSSASRSRRGYNDRDSRDNAAFIALDNED